MVLRWWRKRGNGWHWRMTINAVGAHNRRLQAHLHIETSEAGGFLQRERESLDHHLLVPVARYRPAGAARHRVRGVVVRRRARRKAAARVAAVHVTDDRKAAAQLQTNWNATHLGIPLVVLESPYRETAEALIRYIDFLQSTGGPRTVVTVVLPETMRVRWCIHSCEII